MPLGILLKNENKVDDMVDIMKALHQYVPSEEYASNTYKTCVGEVEVPQFHLKKIFFGGDQLTAARSRSAKVSRVNSVARTLRLDGLIPCAEDWHVKLNFLDVSILYLIVMKRYMNT